MRGRNTRADGSTLDPLLQWFAKAVQGKVGQLSAAVIKDGPIWRFPIVKRPRTRMLIISGYRTVRSGERFRQFLACIAHGQFLFLKSASQ
jgi:hypothetical protein